MAKETSEKVQTLYAKLSEVKSIYDEIDKSGVADEDVPQETKSKIITLNKEIEELSAAVEEGKEFKGLRDLHVGMLGKLDQPDYKAPHAGGQPASHVKSLGAEFVDNPTFKSWRDNIMPNGSLPNGFRIGEGPPTEINNLLQAALHYTKATAGVITGASASSGGAMVQIDYQALVNPAFRPLTLRDIVTNGNTQSDTIEYPRVTGYNSNATPTAEATTTSNGTKPQSDFTLEKVTEHVKTIPTWVAATRRALADAGQLRTLIDAFLMQAVAEELENQMIGGDGAGENFTGIANTPNIGSQSFDTDLIVTARKARTKVRLEGRKTPTAYVFHPSDWEAFDLSVDNEMRYYFGGPQVLGTPRLWGMPVVECEGCTPGTGWVGYWPGCVVWDREQANIRMSDSHANFFIQNLVAILAELRAAFGVLFPKAMIEIDLTA
jgi:HK97 family phage major capsid protein